MTTQSEWMRLERKFDAPIEAVWAMWTDPALFRKWFGPQGALVPVAEMDVTIGGTRKICMEMRMPDRTLTMWFTGTYKEITPPHRLIYTESMCEPNGKLISPQTMGMPLGTPQFTEIVLDLKDDGGATLLALTHVGIPAGTPGERGWAMALDKLAAALPD